MNKDCCLSPLKGARTQSRQHISTPPRHGRQLYTPTQPSQAGLIKASLNSFSPRCSIEEHILVIITPIRWVKITVSLHLITTSQQLFQSLSPAGQYQMPSCAPGHLADRSREKERGPRGERTGGVPLPASPRVRFMPEKAQLQKIRGKSPGLLGSPPPTIPN